MHSKQHFRNVIFGEGLRPQGAALAILLLLLFLIFVLLFMTLTTQPAQAQTFNVIYNFTGGADGAGPHAGLTIDRVGNLYGTAAGGGAGAGTVFRLTHQNSTWILVPLHSFQGGNDGAVPFAGVIFGPDGSLYGTTAYGAGGCSIGCGTVFRLRPLAYACKTALCPWTETVLYRFMGGNDGAEPAFGDLNFGADGGIYGTTMAGGASNDGVVYKLMPSSGSWTESIIHTFTGGNDGALPYSGVIIDKAANLYGTTYLGGGAFGMGAVYELTPSGSGWAENIVHSFVGYDGVEPVGGLIFDRVGNLYGITSGGGSGSGTIFEVTPPYGYPFTVLYSLAGNGEGSTAGLIMDAAGNLYGTTIMNGAYGYGSVFKLTASSGGWAYTDLHDFTGGSDGGYPWSGVTLDANGNLYGTASQGGAGCGSPGCGVVWQITP